MTKKFKRSDYLFAVLLVVGILFLCIFIFTHQNFEDESFYPTVSYRLINGDSLVQHEWNLTQFSSLFSYLPVRLWLTLMGSADGLIVFIRCIYIAIHATASVVIYAFFRKYGKWSVAAALLFLTMIPYRMLAISYVSIFVIGLLLFTLCLLAIHYNASPYLYVLAGCFYGVCCVCNPFCCILFVLYFILCVLLGKRKTYRDKDEKNHDEDNNSKLCSGQKKYNKFFSRKAFLYSFLGILIIAIIAVVFFFATGGTINSILENIDNLVKNSEYKVFSSSIFSKLEETAYYFNKISLNLPFLLPLMFIALLLDKKRKLKSHTYIYMIVSLALGIMYAFGMIQILDFRAACFTLPFSIFSTTCYILTENKNKTLFYCMWVPCAIASILQFVAANTFLTSLGTIFAVNNVAGVFFVKDLFYEMKLKLQASENAGKKVFAFGRALICIAFCVQLLLQCVTQSLQIPTTNAFKTNVGPYSGLYMTEKQYVDYMNIIDDITLIKERSNESDPLLIASYNNWAYMYAERPFAVSTTWYKGKLQKDELIAYYKENPDRIPKYIYIDAMGYNGVKNDKKLQENVKIAEELFDCTQEELSYGVLLYVENYKFS